MSLLLDRHVACQSSAPTSARSARAQVDKHRCYWRVEKTHKPEPNKGELKIWNLSREQRAQIEEMRPKKGRTTGIPVLIEGGYKSTGSGADLSRRPSHGVV
jgi:Spy/CpxP family protein refolding chaperone